VSRPVDEQRRYRDAARQGSAQVQGVLLSLGELSGDESAAATAERVKVALASLTQLEALAIRDGAYFDRLDAATDELSAAAQRLGELEPAVPTGRLRGRLESAVAQLRRCRERTLEALAAEHRWPTGASATGGPFGFLASEGAPRLHRLVRPRLAPSPEPTGHRGAAPGSEPAAALEPRLTEGELDHLRSTARDCLSELAGLCNLRVPLPRAAWGQAEPFEQRLLATLDGLMSLVTPLSLDAPMGWDVLAEVERYGREGVVPDPGRQLARVLCLGSVHGDDVVDAALSALRTAPGEVRRAMGAALALAPNPEIGPQVSRLCRDGAPELLPLLLEVLRQRREADIATLTALTSHPDVAVQAAVARTLAQAGPTELAIPAL
jgi:hypothetical protein